MILVYHVTCIHIVNVCDTEPVFLFIYLFIIQMNVYICIILVKYVHVVIFKYITNLHVHVLH